VAKIIGLPTYDHPNLYTIALKDGSIAEYEDNILSTATEVNSSVKTLLPSWVKGGANATLFLHTMSKPRHGTLQLSNDVWSFYPGKSPGADSITLPDLSANCQELLDTGQLFRGHAKFRNVYDVRNQLRLCDCVLRHVSAHGLKSLVAPLSLKHHPKMDSNDKLIWDAAYDKEYDGLVSLPTWDIITEEQFRRISKKKSSSYYGHCDY
jgi:hypothetical protein